MRSRGQLVLDFSRKEVVDFIFESIAEVIDEVIAEYIKMDYNRGICNVFTAVEGYQNYGQIMHRYIFGVYDFLERMNQRWPERGFQNQRCGGHGRLLRL